MHSPRTLQARTHGRHARVVAEGRGAQDGAQHQDTVRTQGQQCPGLAQESQCTAAHGGVPAEAVALGVGKAKRYIYMCVCVRARVCVCVCIHTYIYIYTVKLNNKLNDKLNTKSNTKSNRQKDKMYSKSVKNSLLRGVERLVKQAHGEGPTHTNSDIHRCLV